MTTRNVNIPVMQEVRYMNLIVRDQEPKTYELQIKFQNDAAVGITVRSLIRTVKAAMENSISEPPASDLLRVIDMASQLMPHAELGVFDEYQKEIRVIRRLLSDRQKTVQS